MQVAQSVVNEAISRSSLDQAYQPRLPQLVGQANIADASNIVAQSPDYNKAVLRLELGTLPFGSAWKLGHQRQVEFEASQISKIESVQDVTLLVKQLYFTILRDEDSIANFNNVENELKRLLTTVIPKFQFGRSISFDVMKVKTATYDLTRARELLHSQLVGEKSQLSQIIAAHPETLNLKPVSAVPPLKDFSQASLDDNPTLKVLSKSKEASSAAVSVAKAQRLPSLSGALEYGAEGVTVDTMTSAWTASVQFRLTIFDWGLISSQVDQAKASVTLSEKKLEAETQKTKSDLAQTYALAEAHLADQKRLAAILSDLKRTAIISTDKYRRSAIGIIEATDAISLWLQNSNTERDAYYSYLSDLARLERLTGQKDRVKYE